MMPSFAKVITLALSLGAIPAALANPVAAGSGTTKKVKQYVVECPGMSTADAKAKCLASPHNYRCNLEGMIGYDVPNAPDGCNKCKCIMQ